MVYFSQDKGRTQRGEKTMMNMIYTEMTEREYETAYRIVMSILESPESSEELEKTAREFFETIVFVAEH